MPFKFKNSNSWIKKSVANRKHNCNSNLNVWKQNEIFFPYSFPVAQMVEHGASNAKIMASIPRESKSW